MTYGALTNEVGYITDIPWLLWIDRSKTTPSPSGAPSGSGWFSTINPCNHGTTIPCIGDDLLHIAYILKDGCVHSSQSWLHLGVKSGHG